jgi:uncharacterized coiled-coil protein SlyX
MADIDIAKNLVPQNADRIALFRGEKPDGGTCTVEQLLANIRLALTDISTMVAQNNENLQQLGATVAEQGQDISTNSTTLADMAGKFVYATNQQIDQLFL